MVLKTKGHPSEIINKRGLLTNIMKQILDTSGFKPHSRMIGMYEHYIEKYETSIKLTLPVWVREPNGYRIGFQVSRGFYLGKKVSSGLVWEIIKSLNEVSDKPYLDVRVFDSARNASSVIIWDDDVDNSATFDKFQYVADKGQYYGYTIAASLVEKGNYGIPIVFNMEDYDEAEFSDQEFFDEIEELLLSPIYDQAARLNRETRFVQNIVSELAGE